MAERKVEKVIIVGNSRKNELREGIAGWKSFIAQLAEVVAFDLEQKLELECLEADMVVVFGGDGEVLSVSRRLGTNQLPCLGVNVGKLGFLNQLDVTELEQFLPRIFSGEYTIAERMMLECELVHGGDVGCRSLALNDVVVSRGAVSRLVHLILCVDGHPATSYSSDGLIVSTPLGSTAHSLSAGGPILEPDFEAMIITPICAHSLTDRPIVISPVRTVEIKPYRFNTEIGLTVDGQFYHPLQEGDSVRVWVSPEKFRQVLLPGQCFFRSLREKLGWRGSIERKERGSNTD